MTVHPIDKKHMAFVCEMCKERALRKPAYLWVPDMQKITGTPSMRICRKCAIREHGKRNKTKLDDKPKVKDKDDGKNETKT